MPTNPILEELYAVRRQLLEEHGDNLSSYLQTEFARLKAAGHPISNIQQRSLRSTKRGEAERIRKGESTVNSTSGNS